MERTLASHALTVVVTLVLVMAFLGGRLGLRRVPPVAQVPLGETPGAGNQRLVGLSESGQQNTQHRGDDDDGGHPQSDRQPAHRARHACCRLVGGSNLGHLGVDGSPDQPVEFLVDALFQGIVEDPPRLFLRCPAIRLCTCSNSRTTSRICCSTRAIVRS